MSTARPHVRPFADLLALFVPPAIWFAQFTTLYLAEALMCAKPITQPGALVWIGGATTMGALAALVAFALLIRRRAETGRNGAAFLYATSTWLTILAGLAAIWTAFPLSLLPACAPPAG